MPLSFLPYLAPLALMAVAAIAVARPGFRPRSSVILAELAAVCAMLVAAGSAIWLGMHGAVTSPLIGVGGVGLAVRIDVVSMVMFGLVLKSIDRRVESVSNINQYIFLNFFENAVPNYR